MVALPRFNRYGNLPPGIHPAEWADFADHFGKTPERQILLRQLRGALDLLQSYGCRRVWIGGSFVTDVERITGYSPNDVDVCWAMEGVNLDRLGTHTPELHPIHFNREFQRQRYGGDYFPVSEPLIFGMVERFQRDRHSRPRGIVVLQLEASGSP